MGNIIFYNSPLGNIGITESNGYIDNLFFQDLDINNEYIINETPLLKEAKKQLEEYFSGKRKEFDLPLAPAGTEFMKKDWQALLQIPYGETRSYKEIAAMIGKPKACRAVGMANNRNPIAIIIPCHRVIGSNGSLIGYAGGLHIKSYLLNLEKKYK
ncbi:methylated-DNA--[protein]-cysteine S-methyltransferase [Anaerovorax odorimutans]|uniref:methylated-DNA--[protein]-cysteine S-methyltransferase n=1 Tax=Anaerovorax odorimutans TaxID=109327 RepID=UPI0004213C84|nr:methylated-DNA--[protein]-cysteine S-methyltransferase [Anaerovorax odorimutans]